MAVKGKANRPKVKQRKSRYTHIYDDELWSLTDTIAEFVAPRLRRMAENPAYGSPEMIKDFELWSAILKEMAEAFELIYRNGGDWDWTKEEKVKIEEGLNAFRYWYFGLWT